MNLPLILAGHAFEREAALGISQQYGVVTNAQQVRTLNGSAKRFIGWEKLTTTIGFSGFISPGLDNIDWNDELLVQSVQPRLVYGTGASNVINLPPTRRTDLATYGVSELGYAIVNGRRVFTSVALVNNAATLTPVTDATRYACGYYPEFTGFAQDAPAESVSDEQTYSAQVTIEQS